MKSLDSISGLLPAGEAEAIYIQLNALLAAAPNLTAVDDSHNVPEANLMWLGEVDATIDRLGSISHRADLKIATNMLINTRGSSKYATQIKMIIYRCLGEAQRYAPKTAQSAFIATGSDFDAFVAIQKVIQHADKMIMMIDPYMDQSAIATFCVLANETVSISLLSDTAGLRPALKPAAEKWISQYGDKRPLKVRAAPERSLHDRIIIVDASEAWILTQSLKDFAARSPATIQKVDPQLAQMKFEAYSEIWEKSAVVAE